MVTRVHSTDAESGGWPRAIASSALLGSGTLARLRVWSASPEEVPHGSAHGCVVPRPFRRLARSARGAHPAARTAGRGDDRRLRGAVRRRFLGRGRALGHGQAAVAADLAGPA